MEDATHHYDSTTGAFTGEVSAEMLEDLGIPWVILGHSERRTLLGRAARMVLATSPDACCTIAWHPMTLQAISSKWS